MTHTVTHTTKRVDGNSGEDRTYLPQYTERKGSKIPENRQMEHPDTLCNQQVMCSSHTTSSKKHRKPRFSVLFCCKNAENGVGQNVGQPPDPHRDPHRQSAALPPTASSCPMGTTKCAERTKEHRRGNCFLSGALLACGTYRICAMKLPMVCAAFCCICRVAWV